MTIDKALELQINALGAGYYGTDTPLAKAIMLGIEALKVLKHGRLIGPHHDPALLPGETQE